MITYSTFRQRIGIAMALLSLVGFCSGATANPDTMRNNSSFSFVTYADITEPTDFPEFTSPALRFQDTGWASPQDFDTNALRIKGWKIQDNVYLGHSKVGNRSAVGLLIEHRGFVYGISNRGLEILKRF